MSAKVIDFDAARISTFLMNAIESFFSDPPDSEFQRGYLSALINVYAEGLGRKDDRIAFAEKLATAPEGR